MEKYITRIIEERNYAHDKSIEFQQLKDTQNAKIYEAKATGLQVALDILTNK